MLHSGKFITTRHLSMHQHHLVHESQEATQIMVKRWKSVLCVTFFQELLVA